MESLIVDHGISHVANKSEQYENRRSIRVMQNGLGGERPVSMPAKIANFVNSNVNSLCFALF